MGSNVTYRVRPLNKNTLDELTNSYLWFSRPSAFKGDSKDGNIGAFVTDTPAIKKGFLLMWPDFPFEEWYRKMDHTGICCFTTQIPTSDEMSHFPRCKNGKGICIEYDKLKLTNYFARESSVILRPEFFKVIYNENPTKLDSCDKWSILWEDCGEKGEKRYRTIPEIFSYSHPRDKDEFIYKLLTRLNSRFKNQKEERLIIGSPLAPSHEEQIQGYKVPIPNDAINHIFVYPKVGDIFKRALQNIESIKNKINLVKD